MSRSLPLPAAWLPVPVPVYTRPSSGHGVCGVFCGQGVSRNTQETCNEEF